jgi:hypothetical protein
MTETNFTVKSMKNSHKINLCKKRCTNSTGTKTDMKSNGIEWKTLTQTHATTAIFDKGAQHMHWRKKEPL